MRYIDLRSDTVTLPTEEMRHAMHGAPVGDDVFGDDPTMNRLEALAAETVGKEAAVFVPSGTMGNQIAIMAHTWPGDEIIVGENSHVYVNEAGGPARLSGVSCALAPDKMTADDVRRLFRDPQNIHYPRTRLVCLENALGNGDVIPLEQMREVGDVARRLGLAVHLDGARLFNAALALGVGVKDIAGCVDSVMFCVSKGLCSPVGSLVCGNASFIGEVRRCRKLLGGGMRQAGVLAACAILSIMKMSKRLDEDHENAALLGKLLGEISGVVVVNADAIRINMVFWRCDSPKFDAGGFGGFMEKKGVKVADPSGGVYRFVTHYGVVGDDIEYVAKCVREYVVGL